VRGTNATWEVSKGPGASLCGNERAPATWARCDAVAVRVTLTGVPRRVVRGKMPLGVSYWGEVTTGEVVDVDVILGRSWFGQLSEDVPVDRLRCSSLVGGAGPCGQDRVREMAPVTRSECGQVEMEKRGPHR
jgi:hypothetical protein